MKYLLLLSVLFLSAYGVKKSSSHYISFEQSKSLLSVSHKVPPIMLYPRNIYVCDDNLVVFNEGLDTLFQVFNLNDFSYKYSFGIKGHGPNDFIMPSVQAAKVSNTNISILDMKTIKNISFKDDKHIIRTESLDAPFEFLNGFVKLYDSLFCCDAGLEEEKEFMFINHDGSFEQWGEYPENTDRLGSTLARNQAYAKISVSKPDGSRFAAFYNSQRHFRIYDDSGKLLHDVYLDISPFEELPAKNPEERYIHTISAYATDKYIYTLNLDMKAEEIASQKCFPNIQVFSWNGKPLKQYSLDRFISSFTVCEKQNKIYGVFVDDDEHIYSFDM